jgi:hypothetical protein
MPHDVRVRYQSALKRQARQGSIRTMPELLDTSLI